ncbi:MAG: glycosyltransferase family 9 protein [Candidatus Eisenbacteria bacterium]|nr:glycosyltransferase family 9 protein [Candidatus Eisenbacteria bacterium]
MKPLQVPAAGFRRIAVLRLSSLGDVILTLPVVHALHRAYPGARIEYWTREEYGDVLRFDPAVGHVRALERDAMRIEDLVSMSAELEECDLIVDLHGSARTRVLTFRQKGRVLRAPSSRVRRLRWVHARWSSPAAAAPTAERYARSLAPLSIATHGAPRMTCGGEAEAWADAWIARRGFDRPVAIAPAARHATKQWIESSWIEIADRLGKKGIPVLAFSLAREKPTFGALAAAIERRAEGAWLCESLPRMAALLSRCRAAVTCDSGLMHLAAARALRVVALYGSTVPELGFAPQGEGHAVLCRHEPCQPCTLHGRERCPLGHFRCMTGITPDEVWSALAVDVPAAR